MPPEILIGLVVIASAVIKYRNIFKTQYIYEKTRPEFIGRVNDSKMLSDEDVVNILNILNKKATQTIIFILAACVATVSNFTVLFFMPDIGPVLQMIFAFSNGYVFVHWNHAHKIEKFIRECENTMLARTMQDKATKHAGADSKGPKQDMLDWLDHENEELEREMRENGEWPPTDDE